MQPRRTMTDRNVYLWGAGLSAVGLALLLAARAAAGEPLALALVAYAVVQAVVLRWGLLVYGAPGALGALALSAFAGPLLAAGGGLGAAAAWLLVGYATSRCLLDPTLQGTLAIAAAVLLAGWLAGAAASVPALGVYALLLALVRAWTVARWEPRGRVLQASLVALVAGWGMALAAGWLIGRVAPGALWLAAAKGAGPPGSACWPLALVPLLLTAARPWRAERRASDLAWLIGLLAIGGVAPVAAVVPFAALLAGAGWDAARPPWLRRAASALVVLHVAGGAAWALVARAEVSPAAVERAV